MSEEEVNSIGDNHLNGSNEREISFTGIGHDDAKDSQHHDNEYDGQSELDGHQESSSSSSSSYDGNGLPFRQFRVMIWKNSLIKRRALCGSCCECLTPIILVILLIFGFRLSSSNTTPPQIFVNQTLPIQSMINDLVTSVAISNNLPFPDNNLPFIQASDIKNTSSASSSSSSSLSSTMSVTSSIANIATALISYNGPIPTIPFDIYVGINSLLRLLIESSDSSSSSLQTTTDRFSIADPRFDNLINLGKLVFVSPPSPSTDFMYFTRLLDRLNSSYVSFSSVFDRVYTSENDAVNYAMRDVTLDMAYNPKRPGATRTWAIIVFSSLGLDTGHIDYTIRLNYTAVPSTKSVFNQFQVGVATTYTQYYFSGYLSIQDMVDRAILEESFHMYNISTSPLLPSVSLSSSLPSVRSSPSFISAPFPVGGTSINPFYATSGPFVALVLCMSVLYPVSRFIKLLVEEKEEKTKELLLMMNLRPYIYYLSHFASVALEFTVIALVCAILLSASIFQHSQFLLLLLLLWLFVMSMVLMSFLVSIFFSRAKLAGIVGPILVFSLVMPRYAFLSPDGNFDGMFATFMLSPAAFAFSVDILMEYEGANMGVTFRNMYDKSSFNGLLSFADVLAALLVDCLGYLVLTIYIDAIWPNQYGSHRHPLFLCTRRFWSSSSSSIRHSNKMKDHSQREESSTVGVVPSLLSAGAPSISRSQNHEPSSQLESDKYGIRISSLAKRFSSGWGKNKRYLQAVKDLSLNMEKNQITALLGHNGAGKTTTISMLTGLISPSSGSAEIGGFSIATEMNQIRSFLGVCPQVNVIFPTLSAKEHLEIYATLKGVPPKNVSEAVDAKLREVGLHDARDRPSGTYSGGMKRKLCVAMAIIGPTKVAFFDEPTSGMDPYSRRFTWDLLKKYKSGRTIVLTTHFMDEADLLGDKIAIMSKGSLRCFGTSLYLKARFGVGYSLTMVKEQQSSLLDDKGNDDSKRDDALVTSSSPLPSLAPPLSALSTHHSHPLLPKSSTDKTKEQPGGRDNDDSSDDGSHAVCFHLPSENENSNDSLNDLNGHGNSDGGNNHRNIVSGDGVGWNPDALLELIGSYIPDYRFQSRAAGELSVQLPVSSVPNFARLFESLDSNKKKLGMAGYGLAMTTLEDVFLRIAQEADEEDEQLDEDQEKSTNENNDTRGESAVLSSSRLQHNGTNIIKVRPPSKKSLNDHRPNIDNHQQQLNYLNGETLELELLSPLAATRGASASYSSHNSYSDHNSIGPEEGVMNSNRLESKSMSSAVHPSVNVDSHAQMLPEAIRKKKNPSHNKDNLGREPSSYGVQLSVLLEKRFLCAIRDVMGRFFEVVLPVGVIAIVLLILLINIELSGPSIPTTATLYGTPSNPMQIVTSNNRTDQVTNYFLNRWNTPPSSCSFSSTSASSSSSSMPSNSSVLAFAAYSPVSVIDSVSSLNSLDISEYLLSTIGHHPDNRIMSVNIDDSVLFMSATSFHIPVPLIKLALSSNFSQLIASLPNTTSTFPFSLVNGVTDLNNLLAPFGLSLYNVTNLINSLNFTSGNVTLPALPSSVSLVIISSNQTISIITIGANSTITIPLSQFLLPTGGSFNLGDLLANFTNTLNFTVSLPNGTTISYSIPLNLNGSLILQGGTFFQNITVSLTSIRSFFEFLSIYNLGNGTVNFQLGALRTDASVTVLHNTSYTHALPVMATELMRARLQVLHAGYIQAPPNQTITDQSAYINVCTPSSSRFSLSNGSSSSNRVVSYVVRNHPLPVTARRKLTLQAILSILAALFTLIPFCYLPAAFIIFLVKERSSKAQHLQYISGVSPVIYWISNYIFDMINYTLICTAVLVIFYGYNNRDFIGTSELSGATFLLFFLYGAAAIPLSYNLQFLFDNHTSAQIGIAGIHFVTGFLLTIASYIMDGIALTSSVNGSLKPVYRLFPPYVLGEGMISLSSASLISLITGSRPSPFDFSQLGKGFVYLALESVAFFVLTILIDMQYIPKILNAVCFLDKFRVRLASLRYRDNNKPSLDKTTQAEQEDDDVTNERKRIESMSTATSMTSASESHGELVYIHHLRKQFPDVPLFSPPKVAVHDLSLGIPTGEVFGFLGVNGAGKSTTISMLTGELNPTSGDGRIGGFDIVSDRPSIRHELGYCPQFDPLLDSLTAREHLRMFARIRGIKGTKEEIESFIDGLINKVTLTPHADRQAETYSGGNKRKLSLACAIVGSPKLVLLDEPSTGMDPVSRRYMWNTISSLSREMSILLTTHSMEECEALCSRVGIMISGRLRCLGTLQHLKSKFGSGYSIEINIRDPSTSHINDVIKSMCGVFQGAHVDETHSSRLKISIPKTDSSGSPFSLSYVFTTLEDMKHKLDIIDYSISQPTLEQVFVGLVKGSESTTDNDHQQA